MTMITDITSRAEYEAILNILPGKVLDLVASRIHQVEEIVLDKGQNLRLKIDGLRIEYPILVDDEDLKYIAGKVGKFRGDGRRGLSGTLHRISAGFDEKHLVDKITVRVARAIMGVAEPLRPYIEQARGIAVVGPPAVGKTTLLRDIARIRAEVLSSGLLIIDSSNEITGDGDIPHPMMRRIRRFKVAGPEYQAEILKLAIRNHGPEEVLMDEVGYNGDVPLLVSAANWGVSVIATMHGSILRDVLENPPLVPMLGVSVDERTGGYVRRARPVFNTAIEVHGKGQYLVHTNLSAAIDELVRGGNPEGIKVGRWPEVPEFQKAS